MADASTYAGRFAPSTTGLAHPGTLLAALLCWLEARSRGGRVELRLEDLDPERCKPGFAEAMCADLAWLGLDWDAVVLQSTNSLRHALALDRLAEAGLLYPCTCARSEIRARARRARDGSWRYDGRCRARRLPTREDGGWRATDVALRVRVPDHVIDLEDASGLLLSGNPADDYGIRWFAGATVPSRTTWPAWSTTPLRASPTSCAAATSRRAPWCRSPFRTSSACHVPTIATTCCCSSKRREARQVPSCRRCRHPPSLLLAGFAVRISRKRGRPLRADRSHRAERSARALRLVPRARRGPGDRMDGDRAAQPAGRRRIGSALADMRASLRQA